MGIFTIVTIALTNALGQVFLMQMQNSASIIADDPVFPRKIVQKFSFSFPLKKSPKINFRFHFLPKNCPEKIFSSFFYQKISH